MKEYSVILKQQRFLEEQVDGDNILEPQSIVYDSENEDVYWRKWRNRRPLKINKFRIYVMRDQQLVLVNILDYYRKLNGRPARKSLWTRILSVFS